MEETTETIETKAPEPEVPAQDEKDWKAEYEKAKAESRKWEARSKENKEKADKFDALQETSKTEAEKAEAAEKRATEAEAFAEQAKAELERMHTLTTISEEMKVPVSLIRGDTEDEMREYAQSILDFKAESKPSIPKDQGGSTGKPLVTKDSIEAIEDPVERVRARAKNLSLYQ